MTRDFTDESEKDVEYATGAKDVEDEHYGWACAITSQEISYAYGPGPGKDMPPSVEELRKRLNGRGTDAPEVIESRIAKAEFELSYADKFDVVIINDDLDTAKADALKVISDFLKK